MEREGEREVIELLLAVAQVEERRGNPGAMVVPLFVMWWFFFGPGRSKKKK